jgi:hypothetical protein
MGDTNRTDSHKQLVFLFREAEPLNNDNDNDNDNDDNNNNNNNNKHRCRNPRIRSLGSVTLTM